MTERDYAIRSFKEITLNAAQHTEERMDLYYEKIKALMNKIGRASCRERV